MKKLKCLLALLLALLGFFLVCGLHRLYAGKVISGLLQLITVGFFGIWQVCSKPRNLITLGFTFAWKRRPPWTGQRKF